MMTDVANASAATVRVGVILDSLSPPAWAAKILHDIQASSCARIVWVVVPVAKTESIFRERMRRVHSLSLFRLYEKLDSWLVKRLRAPRDAFGSVDLRAFFAAEGIAIDSFLPEEVGNLADSRASGDHARICPDLLIDLRARPSLPVFRVWPRYGVWRLRHGSDQGSSAGAPLFAEMVEKNPVSESSLEVLAQDFDRPLTIYRSFSPTNFFSLYWTRNRIYWKTAEFIMRRLRDLHRHGWDYIRSLEQRPEITCYQNIEPRTPTNLTMVRFFLGLFLILLRRGGRTLLFKDQWLLAVRARGAGAAAKGWTGVRLIIPPPDRFYADPFIIRKGDRTYIFFEDYRFKSAKGLISYIEIGMHGQCTEPEVVLERDYHLSYPFLFEWQGHTYLLPETSANRTVELYRAVDFPRRWERVQVLMENINALDATLTHHNGTFWLFTIIPAESKLFDELYVFSADSPLGPWRPHPDNPVVSDVRRARPAGRLFSISGRLFRPAQDCSIRYGHAIVLHRIEALSETAYHEVAVRKIDPQWFAGNLATHTLNCNDDFEVLDAQIRLLRNPLSLLSRTRRAHSVRLLPAANQENHHVVPEEDVACHGSGISRC
jgi:hypothetical protein